MSDYLDAQEQGFAIGKDGCCCCDYLRDTFARVTGRIAADNINIKKSNGVDSTRYKEDTPGSWIVGVGTGRLLCQTDDEPLYFVDATGGGGFLNVLISATLYDATDTVSIIAGATEIKLSFPATNKIKVEFVGGDSWTHEFGSSISFPRSGTFGLKIFDRAKWDELNPRPDCCAHIPADCMQQNYDVLQIVGTLNHFAALCLTKPGDYAASEFDKYGVSAKAGVTIQDLSVTRSIPKCDTPPEITCRTSCYPDPIPATLTVNVAGFTGTGKFACVNFQDYFDCVDLTISECNDCTGASLPNCYDPGEPCNQDLCVRCMRPNMECKTQCDCSCANGAWVISRNATFPGTVDVDVVSSIFGDCDCLYTGVYNVGQGGAYYTDGQIRDCETYLKTVAEGLADLGYEGNLYIAFAVAYSIAFYDCDDDVLHYNLSWQVGPSYIPGAGLGYKSPAPPRHVSAFCEGDSVEYSDQPDISPRFVAKRLSDGAYINVSGFCSCYGPAYEYGLPYGDGVCTIPGCYSAGSSGHTVTTTIDS